MKIEIKNSVDSKEWNDLVEKDDGSVFKKYEWANVNQTPKYITAIENGKLVGGLAFHEDNVLFKAARVAISSPIATNNEVRSEIVRFFRSMPGMKIVNTTYQDDKFASLFLENGFKKTDKATVLINLKNYDTDLKSFDKKRRYDINKAIKEGAEVADASENERDWEEFYKIYNESGKNWGVSILDKNEFLKFKSMVKQNLLRLFLVKLDGKIISGSIVLNSGNTAIFFINATDPNERQLQTNSLLMWENIKYAKKNGFEYFDLFGYDPYAKKNEKTYGINSFKLSFGGEVKIFYKFTDSGTYVVGRELYNKLRFLKRLYFFFQRSNKI